MGVASSKKAANTIREAGKKRLNSPVKFFNFQAWIDGRTPIKQKSKSNNNNKVNEKPKTKRRLFKKKSKKK
jgi:hypothetical protein